MSTALGLLHGLDSTFTLLLLGSVVFYAFILPAGGPAALKLDRSWRQKFHRLTALSFASSALWMLASSAGMADSWQPDMLWMAMTQTTFGHTGCFRLALLLFFLLAGNRILAIRFGSFLFAFLTLGLPLTSSLMGHAAQSESMTALRISADFSHSLTAAIWGGGLYRLFDWLRLRLKASEFPENVTHSVVTRFSYFAIASTALIGFTGLYMAYAAGVPPLRPWGSLYGKLILSKTLFFGIALGIASINQFIHLRAYNRESELSFARAIKRGVGFELVFVLIIFMIAGFLTRTNLPGI